MYSYLNVRDQVLHPYKTTGKIIVQYILTFLILDGESKVASVPAHYTTKAYRVSGGKLHALLTSALDGYGRSA
jgi:hypothetical protein